MRRLGNVDGAAVAVSRGKSRDVPLSAQYQPATKGEIVSAAKAILDKWL